MGQQLCILCQNRLIFKQLSSNGLSPTPKIFIQLAYLPPHRSPYMKLPLALLSFCFISACSISSSKEIKQAEKLLQSFDCQNIERDQADHSSMTSYHEQVLASSKQKAQSYVESYQHGDQIFDLPLPEVIETQLQSYTAACQSLGGVLPNPQQSL